MDALVCEICHSNSFTKLDGYLQCDYCRTKYTPEEARKLLIEGTVNIDRSSEVSQLQILVENLIDEGNLKQAMDTVDQALRLDATNVRTWRLRENIIFDDQFYLFLYDHGSNLSKIASSAWDKDRIFKVCERLYEYSTEEQRQANIDSYIGMILPKLRSTIEDLYDDSTSYLTNYEHIVYADSNREYVSGCREPVGKMCKRSLILPILAQFSQSYRTELVECMSILRRFRDDLDVAESRIEERSRKNRAGYKRTRQERKQYVEKDKENCRLIRATLDDALGSMDSLR